MKDEKKSKRKKAGRPKLCVDEKTVSLTVRISPKLKKKLQDRADIIFSGNLTLCVTDKLTANSNSNIQLNQNKITLKRTDIYALIREYNKIGNNLNQLTKLAHTGKILHTSLEKSIYELSGLHDTLFELMVKRLNENVPN